MDVAVEVAAASAIYLMSVNNYYLTVHHSKVVKRKDKKEGGGCLVFTEIELGKRIFVNIHNIGGW